MPVGGLELTRPPLRREGDRRRAGPLAAVLHHPEVGDGVEQRLARWRGLELEAAQQGGHVAERARPFAQLSEKGVVGRLGEPAYALDRGGERVAGDEREHGRAHIGVRRRRVEDHGAGVTRLQRRRVEVAQGPQPRLPGRRVGLREHRRRDRVEEVDDVVGGRRLERAHEGEQGGRAPVVGQPRHGLRPGGGREARERRHLARRQPVGLRQPRPDRADLPRPRDRAADLGPAPDERTLAQPVEGALPRAVGHDDERVETRPLLRRQPGGEPPEQVAGGARAHAGDRALEHGQARQQHLGGDEPGDRAVEQRRGAVGAGPAERVEEAVQAEPHAGVGELPVALADAVAVPPAARARRVGGDRLGMAWDRELVGDVAHRRRGGVGRVVEEGAEQPHRAELDSHAQTVVVAAVPGDEGAVGVVEVGVARELVGRGVAREAAVAAGLVVGEEADRHRPPTARLRRVGPCGGRAARGPARGARPWRRRRRRASTATRRAGRRRRGRRSPGPP